MNSELWWFWILLAIIFVLCIKEASMLFLDAWLRNDEKEKRK